jgi:hypothetical protein
LLFGCYRDTSNEEQRLIAIGRIILSWVIEKDDSKKAKNAAKADTATRNGRGRASWRACSGCSRNSMLLLTSLAYTHT